MTFDAVLIAGPTASGKSAAALELAEEIGGVVINADSMQVYREARDPDGAARRCRQGARAASALRPCQRARALFGRPLAARCGRGAGRRRARWARVPIFVGGTGLYFMALTEGLADVPPMPPAIRDAARALLDDIGVEALHAELTDARSRDGVAAARPPIRSACCAPLKCSRRPGGRWREWQSAPAEPVLKDLKIAAFVLDPPRPELRARIAAAVRGHAGAGRRWRRRGRWRAWTRPCRPPNCWDCARFRPWQRRTLTRAEALDAAITATRQFAKRQMTWFRNRMPD